MQKRGFYNIDFLCTFHVSCALSDTTHQAYDPNPCTMTVLQGFFFGFTNGRCEASIREGECLG
jgi:hypothetical protein